MRRVAMTANQNELLSALIDGELQNEELDLVLQLTSKNAQAKIQLQRYQLSSDILHGHALAKHNINLGERISAAIADEDTHSSIPELKQKTQIISFPQQFWKQTMSLAIAASIGALAVVGVMTQPQNQIVPVGMPLAAIEQDAEIVVVAQSANRWTVGEAEVEERLNTYLLDHNEHMGAPDVFSYARVVSYGVGQ